MQQRAGLSKGKKISTFIKTLARPSKKQNKQIINIRNETR